MRLMVARQLMEARTSCPSPSHTMGRSAWRETEVRGGTRARDKRREWRREERVGACLGPEVTVNKIKFKMR